VADYMTSVIHLLPVPAFTITESGHITAWNAAAECAFGWQEAELRERTLEALLKSDSLWEAIHRRILSRELRGDRAILLGKKGEPTAVELWSAAVCDADSPHFLVIALLERDLEGAVNTALRAFAGNLSHDFANLLFAESGYLTMLSAALAATTPENPKAAKAVARLNGGLVGLQQIYQRLIAFSQRSALDPSVVSISLIVNRIANEKKAELSAAGIQISNECAFCMRPVEVDPEALSQVIQLLIDCSRKALSKGGTITIRCSNADDDVRITVSDTRGSVPVELLHDAFRPFSRFPQPTGLELAAVDGIMRQSGGQVYADSGDGSGLMIGLLLRAARSDRAPCDALGRAETILAVNDEPEVLKLIKAALSRTGYTVLAASSGEEALHIARKHTGRIDLVVTDVVMPGMSGPMLALQLSEIMPHTKVLLTSGYSDLQILRQPNAAPLLSVPFTVAELLGKVRELLGD
jgi:two-component system cell cycle sensor histidine kinase/response regulator CckA